MTTHKAMAWALAVKNFMLPTLLSSWSMKLPTVIVVVAWGKAASLLHSTLQWCFHVVAVNWDPSCARWQENSCTEKKDSSASQIRYKQGQILPRTSISHHFSDIFVLETLTFDQGYQFHWSLQNCFFSVWIQYSHLHKHEHTLSLIW